MKAPLRFDQSDVLVVAQSELCLVGCGPRTNEAAIFHLMRKMAKRADGGSGKEKKKSQEGDAIVSFLSSSPSPFRRVAVVRDLFDRDEAQRPHLASILTAVREDEDDPTSLAFVVARSVVGRDCLRRRLVNEYALVKQQQQPEKTSTDSAAHSSYRLVRAGVELSEYLRDCLHHPVLLADDSELATRQSWAGAVSEASVAGKGKEAGSSAMNGPSVARVWDTSRAPVASRTTDTILMVAPIGFQLNEETAQDNHFMHRPKEQALDTERKALTEFSGLHRALTAAGVNILLHAAERHHNTPDAVFPNNWFSTHPAAETGRSTLVFYPMKTPSRRAERRQTIVEELQAVYEQEVSFEHWENADPPRFLESTGVLILDRARKVAYAALSQRCSKRVASQWAKRLGYEMCFFHASDAQGQPIYHTNVMMAVGSSVAVVCLESVADLEERENLRRTLSVSHEVVEITRAQVDEFCGNVLEVRGTGGRRVLAMSSRAFAAFTDAQLTVLRRHTDELVHAAIPTIETVGGGGVRCMMAEIF